MRYLSYSQLFIFIFCSITANLSFAQSLQQLDSQIKLSLKAKDYRKANLLLDNALAKTKEETLDYGKYLALKGEVAIKLKQFKIALEFSEKAEEIYNSFPLNPAFINNMVTSGYSYLKLADEESDEKAALKFEDIGQAISVQKVSKDFLYIGERLLEIGNELIKEKNRDENWVSMAMIIFHNATSAFEKGNDQIKAKIARTEFIRLMQIMEIESNEEEEDEKNNTNNSKYSTTKKIEQTTTQNSFLELVAEGPGKIDYSKVKEVDFDEFLKKLTITQQITAHREFGFFYLKIKQNYNKAEEHLTQATRLMKQYGELNSLAKLKTYGDLAILNVLAKRYDKVPALLKECQITTKALNNRFNETNSLSADEKMAVSSIGAGIGWDFDERLPISIIDYLKDRKVTIKIDEFQKISYNVALYSNGLVFNQVYYEREAIQKQGYTELLRFFDDLQTHKLLIAKTPISKRSALIKEVKELEEAFYERIQEFPKLNISLPDISWDQIKDRLQAHQAAVSFVQFTSFSDSPTTHKDTLYAAMIIRADSKSPSFIRLGSYHNLNELLTKSKNSKSLNGRGVGEISDDREEKEKAIYEFVWKPLEPYLTGATQVFFSVEGLLNQVAFSAITLPNSTPQASYKDRYIGGRYKLCQLISTAQLVKGIKPFYLTKDMTSVLIGDIEYNPKNFNLKKANDKLLLDYSQLTYLQSLIQQSFPVPFNSLKATRKEINDINHFLPKSKLFSDKNVSKSNILELSGRSPTIMHFATHAIYLRTKTKKIDSSIDEALMRTALVLSGVNQLWSSNIQFPIKDDGLLTAFEISIQDFSQTRLAVLSACETALGDIYGTEGVFGMQRAFKMAGVEKLIISLWPVEDASTQQFMSLFYQNLEKKQEIRDAFYNTQIDMHKQNNSPNYWASFILLE